MSENDPKNSLTITDNRNGRQYEVDILEGDVIRAMDLRQIKQDEGDFGMMAYDPGFTNTASTRSHITFIDGGKGMLQYRGYPIEQLAERASFLEVAYLILRGELPNQAELDEFVRDITFHTYVHENVLTLLDGFRYDAHAMSMMISAVSALSTFYPEAKQVQDEGNRWVQIERIVAKMPTLAAFAYRHHRGLPYVYPENELSYTANFLNMLFRIGGGKYQPNPVLERALDVLFILHADHEQKLFDHRHEGDRKRPSRPVFGHGRRDGSALRTPPRGRQRGGVADAVRDRIGGQHPLLHGERPQG